MTEKKAELLEHLEAVFFVSLAGKDISHGDIPSLHFEAELHGNAVPQPAQTSNAQSQPGLYDNPPQNASKPTYGKKNGTTSDAPASPKQVKYLLDLARQYGVSPDQIKAKFNVPALESLTKTQCSRAIDELSGKAA